MDRHLVANSLIISDCEGYEEMLFVQASSAHYASATILIELHGDIPKIHQALSTKFTGSHNIETVVASSDDPPCDVDLSFLTVKEIRTAIREIRGEQSWLLLTPKIN